MDLDCIDPVAANFLFDEEMRQLEENWRTVIANTIFVCNSLNEKISMENIKILAKHLKLALKYMQDDRYTGVITQQGIDFFMKIFKLISKTKN